MDTFCQLLLNGLLQAAILCFYKVKIKLLNTYDRQKVMTHKLEVAEMGVLDWMAAPMGAKGVGLRTF